MQTNGTSTSVVVPTPGPNIEYVATLPELPWSNFSELPPHPVQRHTPSHAAKLHASGVLKRWIEPHREVSILLHGETIVTMKAHFAEDPVDALRAYGIKNNGHSRDQLAKTGHWAAPTTCRATIYAASDLEAATVCYNAVDSSTATKVTADKMQSTLGLAKITPVSPKFQKCAGLSTALNLSIAALCGSLGFRSPEYLAIADDQPLQEDLQPYAPHFPYLPIVAKLKLAIETVDQMRLDRKTVPSNPACIGAYLTIVHRDPQDGPIFLQHVAQSRGTGENRRMNPIYVVHNLPRHLSGRKNLKTNQRIDRTFCGLLSAYVAWTTEQDFALDQYNDRDTILSQFNPILRDPLKRALSNTPPPRRRAPPPRPEATVSGAALSLLNEGPAICRP